MQSHPGTHTHTYKLMRSLSLISVCVFNVGSANNGDDGVTMRHPVPSALFVFAVLAIALLARKTI